MKLRHRFANDFFSHLSNKRGFMDTFRAETREVTLLYTSNPTVKLSQCIYFWGVTFILSIIAFEWEKTILWTLNNYFFFLLSPNEYAKFPLTWNENAVVDGGGKTSVQFSILVKWSALRLNNTENRQKQGKVFLNGFNGEKTVTRT